MIEPDILSDVGASLNSNHLKESGAELRRYLDMASERLRFRTRNSQEVRDSLAELRLRLFAWRLRQRSWGLFRLAVMLGLRVPSQMTVREICLA